MGEFNNVFDMDNAIEILPRLRINLIKEIYETLGINLGNTNNEINYMNYMINDLDQISMFGTDNIGNDEFGGAFGGSHSPGPPMISSGQTKTNAAIVMNMLMQDMGLTKEQAAGIAGVMTAESGINPNIWNKGEKNGTYPSSSANNEGAPYGQKKCPWSYGAGICQWTFTQRKESAIMGGLGVSRDEAIRIIKGGGIESLTLQQQVKMLEYELRTTYKYTLTGLKKCTTAEQAAATFYCHAIAGYSTSTNPATQSEVDRMNAKYSHVGANSQINKGMRYAKGYVV